MYEKRSFLEVIKGMFVGLVHPAEYIENGKKGSWGSALILAVIFSILTPLLTFFLPVNSVVGNGRLARLIDNYFADFSLSKDGFYCDGRHEWTDHKTVYVEIDTDNTFIDDDVLEDILQATDYDTVMIIYSKEVLLYSEGQTETLKWSDLYEAMNLNNEVIDKQDVIKSIELSFTPMLRTIYLFLVVFAFIGFLLCGLLWALVGMIAASSAGAKVSFGELVKASIYIRIIWSTVRKLLKVYVFGGTSMLMWVFGFVVILVYMLLAVSKYAKTQPNNIYGGGAQTVLNQNMYYGGQSMGNAAGQYQPMNMNQGINPNAYPNMYQNNPNMYQNNPNMYQNNPNVYQNNPNMYPNNSNMEQNANQYSYQDNNDQSNNDQWNNYQDNDYQNNNLQESDFSSEEQNNDQ